jgi:hypothetical protein
MSAVPSITLRHGPDLLAVVPYLTGEHPQDTIAFVLFTPDPQKVVAATYPLRPDLDPARLLPHLRRTLARVRPTGVAVAAYGPQTTRPALTRLITEVERLVPVQAAHLADAGRSYCLTCPCPESVGGVAFDPAATAAACEATFAGLAAPPPPRDPDAMVAADTRLQAQTAAQITAVVLPANPEPEYRRLIDSLADGVPVTPARVAQLAVLLSDHAVRHRALNDVLRWRWPVGMWVAIVRHLPDAYLATSGNLAAFAAWKADDRELALALFARVLAAHPGDAMASSVLPLVRMGLDFHDVHQMLQTATRHRDGLR